MCGTTYSSLQSSNTSNYQRIELVNLYTVPLSALMVWVVWLSLRRVNEQARIDSKGIGRFENFRIGQSLSNRFESDGRFEF